MIKKLNHIQLCIPPGCESEARDFFCGLLHLQEVEKPEVLKANGGFWLQSGELQIHIGIDPEIRRTKQHPAFEVENLDEAREYLSRMNIRIHEEKAIPGQKRFSFHDPFGNRIEFMELV